MRAAAPSLGGMDSRQAIRLTQRNETAGDATPISFPGPRPTQKGHTNARTHPFNTYVTILLSTMLLEQPPRHLKANPTLKTLHEVERILRAAAKKHEAPLSYAEIARRMSAKAVRFDVVKAVVMELARYGLVAVASDGVHWAVVPESVWGRPSRRLE